MKKIKLILAIALMMPVFSLTAIAVNAEDNKTVEVPTVEPRTGAQTSTSTERITKYKAALTTKVTAAQIESLKIKCKPSQVKSTSLAKTVLENSNKRSGAYSEIKVTIDTIISRLKDANYSSAELEANQVELKKRIASFETDLANYKTALDDVNTQDCVSDPEAFKASLEAARAFRSSLAKDVVNIRTFINDDVKKTLLFVTSELENIESGKPPVTNSDTSDKDKVQ